MNQKNSIIYNLNRSVAINLFLISLLTVFFIASIQVIEFNRNILDDYINEKKTLGNLNSLIIETNENILRLIVFDEKKNSKYNILNILSKSENFQAAFDLYYDAMIKRHGISELSLASEMEPVITSFRNNIVKTVYFYNQGDLISAKAIFATQLSIRVKQIKRFTSDAIETINVLIQDKRQHVNQLQSSIFIIIVLFSGMFIIFAFVFNKKITDSITVPLKVLSNAMLTLARGEYDFKSDRIADDEFGELFDTLTQMSKEIQDSHQQITVAKNSAETASKSKSNFLAMMSHELRTPMNGIIGMTRMLLKTELSSLQRNYTETSLHSSEILLTILNDILDFSKNENGQTVLEQKLVDLVVVVEDVAEHIVLQVQDKNIEVLLDYDCNIPRFVIADSARIRQLLFILLNNAVIYTKKGFIVIKLKLLATEGNCITIMVSIQDSGIGISEQQQNSIFQDFVQADNSSTRQYGGTGLGLAISKQLCKLMDGDIKVESKLGLGSTFTATLKILKNEQQLFNTNTFETPNYSSRRVLIIDSSKKALNIFSDQLSKYHFEVDCASSVTQAMEYLLLQYEQNQSYDAIFIDAHDLEEDETDIAKYISDKALFQNCQLVLIENILFCDDNMDLEYNYLKSQCSKIISKPIRISILAKVLSEIFSTENTIQQEKNVNQVDLQSQAPLTVFDKLQVLLVEDNPVNLFVARDIVENMGCTTRAADNGLVALDLLTLNQFDVIFMDCNMPEMDGFETTVQIRLNEDRLNLAHTIIIALTANTSEDDREKCKQVGMDDFLCKPINVDEVRATLIRWLPNKLTKEYQEWIGSDQHNSSSSEFANTFSRVQQSDEITILDLTSFNQLKIMFGEKFIAYLDLNNKTFLDNIGKAKQAILEHDQEIFERTMHSVKSSSRQIGAMQLGELAASMEQLAKKSLFDEASESMARLLELQQQTATIIKEQLS